MKTEGKAVDSVIQYQLHKSEGGSGDNHNCVEFIEVVTEEVIADQDFINNYPKYESGYDTILGDTYKVRKIKIGDNFLSYSNFENIFDFKKHYRIIGYESDDFYFPYFDIYSPVLKIERNSEPELYKIILNNVYGVSDFVLYSVNPDMPFANVK